MNSTERLKGNGHPARKLGTAHSGGDLMACTIKLWDTAFNAVTDPAIDIIAFDHATQTQILILGNTAVPGGSGGILMTSLHDIFDVVINTNGAAYAPPTLETFGDTGSPADVDVVLHGLPQPGSFVPPSPTDSSELNGFVYRQQGWSNDEQQGVFVTAATLRYVKRQPPNLWPGLLDLLNGIMRSVGIDPDIIV
jgi:hypothetical protein